MKRKRKRKGKEEEKNLLMGRCNGTPTTYSPFTNSRAQTNPPLPPQRLCQGIPRPPPIPPR